MKFAFSFFASVVLLHIVLPVSLGAVTESRIAAMLKAFSSLNQENISYRYQVELADAKTHKLHDHITGALYKYKNTYLDSNSKQIQMRDEKYTLQIDHDRGAAYLKNIRNMERRLKFNAADSQPIAPLDFAEMLRHDAVRIIEEKETQGKLTVVLSFNYNQRGALKLIMNAERQLEGFVLETYGSEDGVSMMKRTLTVTGIKSGANHAVTNTGRFVDFSGSRPKLKGHLSAYPVNVII